MYSIALRVVAAAVDVEGDITPPIYHIMSYHTVQ